MRPIKPIAKVAKRVTEKNNCAPKRKKVIVKQLATRKGKRFI